MIPIIFIHYGNSPYLRYTLKSAQLSNPNKKKILIGDKTNIRVANENGWQHIYLEDLNSKKRDKFNKIFYWIQGENHNPIRGGKDWVRFGFDRFFALENLVVEQKINSFWHFDSDTMIVQDLSKFEESIKSLGIDATTLCDGKCQAGYMNSKALEGFTSNILDDYENKEFIDSLFLEFKKRPGLAFVEFRSFVRFINKGEFLIKQLSSLFARKGIWFDDCICQKQEFKLFYYPKLSKGLKSLYYKKNDFFCQKENNKEYLFITINCSWVDDNVFIWVINKLNKSKNFSNKLLDYLLDSKEYNFLNMIKNNIKRIFWRISLAKILIKDYLKDTIERLFKKII